MALDGSGAVNICSCRDADGVASECNVVSGTSCCVAAGGDTQLFQFKVEASPCAEMCRIVAGQPNHCANLF